VDATIGLLAGAMIDGRRIELRGFGTFDVRPRRKTRRRSPGTGKMMAVPPGLFVRFRAVPGLLATLEACGSARPASRKA
jgi:nucleoid DNA-binding protein